MQLAVVCLRFVFRLKFFLLLLIHIITYIKRDIVPSLHAAVLKSNRITLNRLLEQQGCQAKDINIVC